MNKPILMPELTSTRARTGMNRVGDLIALLIKQYELQEQLRSRQQRTSGGQPSPVATEKRPATGATAEKSTADRRSQTATFVNAHTQHGKSTPVQATFGWFDSPVSETVGN